MLTDFTGSDEEKFKKSVSRVLGRKWVDAWKIGAPYEPEPKLSPGQWLYSYRERSVFEVDGDADDDED